MHSRVSSSDKKSHADLLTAVCAFGLFCTAVPHTHATPLRISGSGAVS